MHPERLEPAATDLVDNAAQQAKLDWADIAASLLADLYRTDKASPQEGDATYHGWVRPDGHTAVVVQSQSGTTYRPLTHLAHHSPAGLAWGFSGNGPRDLARSLLIDALGKHAICPTCDRPPARQAPGNSSSMTRQADQATARRRTANCPNQCDAGILPVPYLRFTEQVIAAHLPYGKAWSLQRSAIIRRLSETHRKTSITPISIEAKPTQPHEPRSQRRHAHSRRVRPPGRQQ